MCGFARDRTVCDSLQNFVQNARIFTVFWQVSCVCHSEPHVLLLIENLMSRSVPRVLVLAAHLCRSEHRVSLRRVTIEPVMDILLCFVAHVGLVHIGLSRWSSFRGIGYAVLSTSDAFSGC